MSNKLTLRPRGGLVEPNQDGDPKDPDFAVDGLSGYDDCVLKRMHNKAGEWFIDWKRLGQVVEAPNSFPSQKAALEWVEKKDNEMSKQTSG